ncbi:GntR family transcriptional regulator [Sinobaca sp. H24]|uniref:GntR family transcriptional regulator n=1 Tax=Sinobaca sp. H24 TaxID=2923376 RepID=UPI002079D077|nr:GntR family transcriptional regulator [Sinobaca sp. H24]
MEELQVVHQTKADEVYAKLRMQIVSGEFMPGDKVTIRQIAGLYQVSMMPVRQALARLHSDGFVTITNRTVKIKELSAKDVKDIFAIRIRLETLALEWAIPHINEEKTAHLQQIIDQMGKEYNPDINGKN